MRHFFSNIIYIFIIINILIFDNFLYANSKKSDSINLQDKKYYELIDKGNELENTGKLEGALNKYYISLSIERYEACSYYAMLDIARVYLKMKKFSEAIYFLKDYISRVEDELAPGSPCSAYTSKSSQGDLTKSKNKANKMLKEAIEAFCSETDDDFLCDKIKPYRFQ
ncbi:MAG: hypothetical protein ACMUIP_17075 [bacterium]